MPLDKPKAGGWGFRIFIIGGVLLALILLVQTVATYVYVSRNLVVQEALRDADRRVNSVLRSMRRQQLDAEASLPSVLDEFLAEWEDSVRWLRVLDPDGAVLAESGLPSGDPISVEDFRTRSTVGGDRFFEIRPTVEGSVLVTASPFRLGGVPGPVGRGGFVRDLTLMEIAIDLDSTSASFVVLRRNLVIGVTAAFALFGMVVGVGFRFPHYLRGKRLENQLELARQVQANLLPSSSASVRGAEITAECRPAWRVGGDFYDAFETREGRLALMLGDVSGKGISTAPLMGFIHGAAHASTWTESSRDHEVASERLNDLLHAKTASERFVTLFWGYLEPSGRLLKYVNAGHVPPLLFRSSSRGSEVVRLSEGGAVLGAFSGARYLQGTVEVEPGDLLLVYSDGIVESEDPTGVEFGEKRLIEVAREHWGTSTPRLRDRILESLDRFTGSTEADDDRTLLIVRFAPDPSEQAPVADERVEVASELVVYP